MLSPNKGVAFALNTDPLHRMVRDECTATTPRARQQPTLLVSARPRGRYDLTLLRRQVTFRLVFSGPFYLTIHKCLCTRTHTHTTHTQHTHNTHTQARQQARVKNENELKARARQSKGHVYMRDADHSVVPLPMRSRFRLGFRLGFRFRFQEGHTVALQPMRLGL